MEVSDGAPVFKSEKLPPKFIEKAFETIFANLSDNILDPDLSKVCTR